VALSLAHARSPVPPAGEAVKYGVCSKLS